MGSDWKAGRFRTCAHEQENSKKSFVVSAEIYLDDKKLKVFVS